MLTVDDVVVRYGSATALDGVSLQASHGEMVALIGPNGAGKSTLVNAISGLVPVASGSISCEGRVAQVPEGRQMFGGMSVVDNLVLGAWRSGDRDPSRIFDLLPALRDFAHRKAGTLSGGQQQMVAVGRALMADPDVLVIDELSLGLAPLIVADLAEHLRTINREHGTTVVLIEQEVGLALDLCSRAYVLEAGRITASGTTAELADSAEVRAAYFGGLDIEEGEDT